MEWIDSSHVFVAILQFLYQKFGDFAQERIPSEAGGRFPASDDVRFNKKSEKKSWFFQFYGLISKREAKLNDY